jgi:hypothetical protein
MWTGPTLLNTDVWLAYRLSPNLASTMPPPNGGSHPRGLRHRLVSALFPLSSFPFHCISTSETLHLHFRNLTGFVGKVYNHRHNNSDSTYSAVLVFSLSFILSKQNNHTVTCATAAFDNHRTLTNVKPTSPASVTYHNIKGRPNSWPPCRT